MGLQRFISSQSIAVVNQRSTSLTLSTLNIIPNTNTNIALVSGDEAYIVAQDTGRSYKITISSDLNYNSTRLQFNSVTLDQFIPVGSVIVIDPQDLYNNIFRKRVNTHIHCYMTGNTHGNDILPNFSQWNFNVNAGSILADGNSKPNRWTSQFGTFIAPSDNTIIEKIVYNFSTNGATGHDFTFSLWKMPTDINGSSNQTISLIDKIDCTSQNNQNYVFNREYTTPYVLNKNEIIFPTIKKTGVTATSSDKFYGDVEIFANYDPRK